MPDQCQPQPYALRYLQPGIRPDTVAGRIVKLSIICLSLGWLAIPVVDLVSSGAPAWRVAAALAGFAVWLGVYVARVLPWFGRTARNPLPGLLAMAAIAAVLTVADRPSWATLFVYCAAAGGMAIDPARTAVRWVGACVALCAAALLVTSAPGEAVGSFTATTAAIGFLMFSYGRVIRANRELSVAREELAERAVDQERLRFARDLHDLLGHNLSVIALKAQLARRVIDSDPELARREIGDVEQVTRTALQEVREAVSGYRQPTLANELAGARSALDAAGIACTVEHPAVALPPSREAVLAWGVREATTNVIRHSGAQRCQIRIEVGLDEAALEVTDDGPAPDPAASDGHGLRGLAERAAAAGGRVIAGPRPDGGFGLELRVPLGRTA